MERGEEGKEVRRWRSIRGEELKATLSSAKIGEVLLSYIWENQAHTHGVGAEFTSGNKAPKF